MDNKSGAPKLDDPMPPPWVKYPEMERASIGWRMGGGEDYLIRWDEWARDKGPQYLLEYFRSYAPLPMEWIDMVAGYLGQPYGMDGIRGLAEQGLADIDVYQTWLGDPTSMCHGGHIPPWKTYRDIPAESVGWHQGKGGEYMSLWRQWAGEKSQGYLVQYFRHYAPLPVEWLGLVLAVLKQPEDIDGIRWLARRGFVDLAKAQNWYERHRRT